MVLPKGAKAAFTDICGAWIVAEDQAGHSEIACLDSDDCFPLPFGRQAAVPEKEIILLDDRLKHAEVSS